MAVCQAIQLEDSAKEMHEIIYQEHRQSMAQLNKLGSAISIIQWQESQDTT